MTTAITPAIAAILQNVTMTFNMIAPRRGCYTKMIFLQQYLPFIPAFVVRCSKLAGNLMKLQDDQ
jgi:hypothetical protein